MIVWTGCSSSKIKERKEQRDRIVQTSKMYCEFINGEQYPDMDVALNLEMAKKCDSEKPFSLTNYKTPTENPGILFCCSPSSRSQMANERARKKEREEKKEDKKEDKKDDKSDEVIE